MGIDKLDKDTKRNNDSRRNFLKLVGASSVELAATGIFPVSGGISDMGPNPEGSFAGVNGVPGNSSIMGEYGPWASSLLEKELPLFSLRKKEVWTF